MSENRRSRDPNVSGATEPRSEAALLDAAHAEFIQERVSINVAARDDANRPALTRAFGCRVDPDRRAVTVFVSAARAEAVLRGVRANGCLAAVFTRPSSHETLQLKGVDAAVTPLAEGDTDRIAAYRASFVADLTRVGYAENYAYAVVSSVGDDLVGIRFTPSAAFVSTPGPKAGQRLGHVA